MHLFQSRQAPARDRNVFHHIGLMVEDLDATVARLTGEGVEVGPVTRVPGGGFAMAKGPDGLLLELFEVRTPESRWYFVD